MCGMYVYISLLRRRRRHGISGSGSYLPSMPTAALGTPPTLAWRCLALSIIVLLPSAWKEERGRKKRKLEESRTL